MLYLHSCARALLWWMLCTWFTRHMQAIYNWGYLWIFYVYLDYNMVTPAVHPQGVCVNLSGMTAKEGARENAHLVEQWERQVVSTWCKQVHAWIVPIVDVSMIHMYITIYQPIHSYDSAWYDITDTNWYHIYIYRCTLYVYVLQNMTFMKLLGFGCLPKIFFGRLSAQPLASSNRRDDNCWTWGIDAMRCFSWNGNKWHKCAWLR